MSSDSETREREDLSGIDSHPVPVSSSHVERIERCDPLYADILEWRKEFRENLVDDRAPEHRDSHASSSHEPSLEPTPTRSADLGKQRVHTLPPERLEFRDLSEDQNYKGPLQKTHWQRRTSRRIFL